MCENVEIDNRLKGDNKKKNYRKKGKQKSLNIHFFILSFCT